MIIGVLGPEGTFSECAARLWCAGKDSSIRYYYADIIDAVDAVLGEEIMQVIVPIENSLEGSVGITLDLLREKDVKIVGEVLLPIEHCLLAKGDISDIRVILSHPQALAQCRRFIKNNFAHAEIRMTESTTNAARLASEFGEIAVVASEDASDKYGLRVLMRNVQDYDENVTRFIVVGREETQRTGDDKTSILIYLQRDKPGALYEILEEFAIRGINLTKVESRPSKKALGDYVFYIDCVGHTNDPEVSSALSALERKVQYLKIIGSYPRFKR
jgi:prephenate dehydratase